MSMEVVNAFNRELKTLLSSKLPVSRQKMSMITKAAIKALKFYKHVVQSVEKFVNKCNPDYKVPALYVIDAIVRQSRHQFCDKDVFGPRFLRNMIPTFLCILQADRKDHHLILRVLNLWQQNEVFPPKIVEALIKLVNDPMNRDIIDQANDEITKVIGPAKVPQNHRDDSEDCLESDPNKSSQEGGFINSVSQLLAKFQSSGQDASDQIRQLQNLQEKFVEQSQLLAQGHMMDCNVLTELHALMEELTRRAAEAAKEQRVRRQQEAEVKQMMQKRIIDFDYGDDSSGDETHQGENNKPTDSTAETEEVFVIDLEMVTQLEQMTETLAQTLALQEELRKAREQGMCLNEENIFVDAPDESQPIDSKEDVNYRDFPPDKSNEDKMKVFDYNHSHSKNTKLKSEKGGALEDGEIDQAEQYRSRNISRDSNSNHESSASPHSRKRRKSTKSRSRSRSSDSHGGGRRRRKRHHSRRKSRDKERERRKKGMPVIKERRVNIFSRTVFVGHLTKTVTEAKLLTTMEELGAVDDFKIIPPRGCAFVTYSVRKSASKAILNLNGTRIDGKDIKVAWAPNRGIKDSKEFRQYWDEDEGCAYIPFIRFPSSDFVKVKELLDGGGELDEESVPQHIHQELQAALEEYEKSQKKAMNELSETNNSSMMNTVASIAPGLPRLPPLPPSIAGVPPPMPFLPPPMLMAAAMQSMRQSDLMNMTNHQQSSAAAPIQPDDLSSPRETPDGDNKPAASLNVNTNTSSATQGPSMSIRPQNNALPPFPGVPSLMGGFGFPSCPGGLLPPAPPPFGLPPFGPGILPPPFMHRKS